MHTKQIGKNLFLIDLHTGGLKNAFCTYLLKAAKPTLVETGPTSSVPNLISGLNELGLLLDDVAFVAITHIHTDHGGGVGTLLKALPNAKVIVHPRGVPHLVDPERLWSQSQAVLGHVSEIFGKPEPVPQDRIVPTIDRVFDLGSCVKFKVIETLGHSSHNLTFNESVEGGFFVGDVAGIFLPEFDAVIPTTPPPFHLDSALASLDRIIELKPTVLYYSHFGKAPNAVQRLEDYKSQLKLWARIAAEGVLAKSSFEDIRNRIFAEDKVMSRLADYLRTHPIYSRTALVNSIQGVVNYAENSKLNFVR